MKKLLNLKTILLGVLLLSVAACQNPTTGVKVTIDMNILKYSALVRITDATSLAVIPGTTMTITGTNASSIYEISGKQVFTVADGNITLGLDPKFNIAGGNATFNVVVSAPNYRTLTQAITFTNGTLQQSINLGLVLATAPPAQTGGTYTPPTPTPTATHFILDFNGHCASKPDLNVRPSLYLYFRDHSAPATTPYLQLGYMDGGHIETNYLAIGKTYDFQITYAGTSYLVTQEIDVPSYTLTFDMGTSICSSF